jgi:hypothetical protein
MVRFCEDCGIRVKDDALFCPNCGGRIRYDADVTYSTLIRDILYVDNRISKAKLAGVLFFVIIVFSNIIFNIPSALRSGFIAFFISMLACFISGLFYYCICRGGGFIIRKFLH